MDTLDANLALGFPGDMREYYIGAQILKDLGAKTLRLLTNNPDKVYQLSDFGMKISERVPIKMEKTAYDGFYLNTKKIRMGQASESSVLQLIIGFKHEINPTRQWVSFVKAASCIKSSASGSSQNGS